MGSGAAQPSQAGQGRANGLAHTGQSGILSTDRNLVNQRPLHHTAPSAYDGRMWWGTSRSASGRESALRPLVPGRLRWAAAGLLAACVAVTAVLATLFVGRGKLGWLDSVMDPRFQALQARFPAAVNWLPDLGTLKPVTLMTLALVLACAATHWWSGAILAVVAEPVAVGLTEYVLKPSIGQAMWWGTSHSYPSGHATGMFALATICAVLLRDPPGRRVSVVIRLLLVIIVVLLAVAVAAAMVAIGAHTFTDAVGGAAVGTGVVMACALALDLVAEVLRGGHWAARRRERQAVDLGDDAAAARDQLTGGDLVAGLEGVGGVVSLAAARLDREDHPALRGAPTSPRDDAKRDDKDP